MNIFESATGHYATTGNPADSDVIVGHSFGTSTDRESPNGALARFILNAEAGQPIVVDRVLAESFPNSTRIDAVVDGATSNVTGSVGGSWEILAGAKKFMDEEGLRTPLMVAQAFHIGRVAMQAERIGMSNVIVPEGLPAIFDEESRQLWTRSAGLWLPREVLGSLVLQLQEKLQAKEPSGRHDKQSKIHNKTQFFFRHVSALIKALF